MRGAQLPTINQAQRRQLFTDILKGVSRSFYLTLRVLPDVLREPIGLAYLLARAADTLADTTALPRDKRLHYLTVFKDRIANPATVLGRDDIQTELQDTLANPAEAQLLARLPQLFALLAAQAETDQRLIRQVVATLTDGMVFDLTTFPLEESGDIKALQYEQELEYYTYLVAGCVGEFWTEISVAHVNALAHWNMQTLTELGIRFGKALQMTNILRDLPRDLRIGRCYMPQSWLDQHGLKVTDLLVAENSAKAQALLQQGIDMALHHFEAAERYVLAIPRHCLRLRLAALWPLLIGLATLTRLANSRDWLDAKTHIKVKRGWVYRMIFKSCFVVCSNRLTSHWLGRLKQS